MTYILLINRKNLEYVFTCICISICNLLISRKKHISRKMEGKAETAMNRGKIDIWLINVLNHISALEKKIKAIKISKSRPYKIQFDSI